MNAGREWGKGWGVVVGLSKHGRTKRELDAGNVLLDRLQLQGLLVRHLDVPEGPDSRGFLMFAQQGTYQSLQYCVLRS